MSKRHKEADPEGNTIPYPKIDGNIIILDGRKYRAGEGYEHNFSSLIENILHLPREFNHTDLHTIEVFIKKYGEEV